MRRVEAIDAALSTGREGAGAGFAGVGDDPAFVLEQASAT